MSEEKRRERDVPRGPKTKSGQRGEHPLRQFSRSMKDFRGGISDLRAVAERLGRARPGERHPQLPSTKAVDTPRADRERPVGRGLNSPMHYGMSRTPRFKGLSPHLPPAQSPANPHKPTLRPTRIHTPEDREAATHLTEGFKGTFEDLPRAARVAMISRAGEILKEEGRRSRLVEALVGSIQAGKPEVAANFSPYKLEKVLSQLLGGRQNALKALWTPEVARMTSTYHYEREVERERLQALERGLPEGSKAPSGSELPLPAPTSSGSPPMPGRSDNRSIDNLFRRNDLLHLRGQAESRRQQLTSQGAAYKAERPTPSPPSQARGEVSMPSVGSPPRKSTAAPAMGEQKRSSDKRKLEGTLTMLSQNGDVLGEARLDGDDTDG
jgi:hypothetical protein